VPSAMAQSTQSEISSPATTSTQSQLVALLQTVGVAPLRHIGWIRVTGDDRVRWLNGMVTNSTQELHSGKGNYNFLLNVQGRVQGDATIFAEPDALLLETASTQAPGLMALLDRFIIMDDVELAEVTGTQTGLLVAGPQAGSLLAKIGLQTEPLEAISKQALAWNSAVVTVINGYGLLVPHYELWTDEATATELLKALLDADAILCEPQSLEWLRILEGIPLYGTDIRDRDLPQETGQDRALHFAKGCYLGQEIVERIRSRGNVHRAFAAVRLNGTLPAAGAKLEADGKEVGELTSVAAIPLSGAAGTVQLALGYVRREALDRGSQLLYPGGIATPVSVPFSAAETMQAQSASESSERV
jgi:folate-binding protein YgfZ